MAIFQIIIFLCVGGPRAVYVSSALAHYEFLCADRGIRIGLGEIGLLILRGEEASYDWGVAGLLVRGHLVEVGFGEASDVDHGDLPAELQV